MAQSVMWMSKSALKILLKNDGLISGNRIKRLYSGRTSSVKVIERLDGFPNHNAATRIKRGIGPGVESHHVIPQYIFEKYRRKGAPKFDMNKEVPCILLSQKEHDRFHALLQSRLSHYGKEPKPSPAVVMETIKQTYRDFDMEDMFDKVEPFLKQIC